MALFIYAAFNSYSNNLTIVYEPGVTSIISARLGLLILECILFQKVWAAEGYDECCVVLPRGAHPNVAEYLALHR